ncbi:MAG: toll/interleukin-1 receptor domain-containing protein [Candidatus Thiodiazotropha sp.]
MDVEREKLNSKVFISHASNDVWVAKQLAKQVQECGADTFLDEENIEHGDDFDNVIIEEAASSSEMLVLFTPIASERKYVWFEMGMFAAARKRIVIVLYGVTKEAISTDKLTPNIIKRIDSVELNDIESYFNELKERVKRTEVNK